MRSGFFGAPLYPIVDTAVFGDEDPGPVVRALADAGVRTVQLRSKSMSAGAFLRWVEAGVRAAEDVDVRIIVNDRADVALLAAADGVHLGQDDLSCGAARSLLGDEAVIGLSTHSESQVMAGGSGAHDYLAIGPVFETGTKKDTAPVVGLGGVRTARSRYDGPLVAIGGITEARVAETLAAGADAVAVVSAIAGDSPAAVRERAESLIAAAG